MALEKLINILNKIPYCGIIRNIFDPETKLLKPLELLSDTSFFFCSLGAPFRLMLMR